MICLDNAGNFVISSNQPLYINRVRLRLAALTLRSGFFLVRGVSYFPVGFFSSVFPQRPSFGWFLASIRLSPVNRVSDAIDFFSPVPPAMQLIAMTVFWCSIEEKSTEGIGNNMPSLR